MPRVSQPTLLLQPEHRALIIRTHTTAEALPRLVGESYRRIAAYLGEAGAMMTDLPYVAYHSDDPDALDVEVGVPVDRELPGQDNLVCVRMSARRTVSCLVRGDTRDLSVELAGLHHFLEERGETAAESVYHTPLNGVDFPVEEQLTRLVVPLLEREAAQQSA